MVPKELTSSCGGKTGAKMNSGPTIIVDADAIIAQINSGDIHHLKVTSLTKKLESSKARFLYPVTAVLEASAHIQRVLGSTPKAYAVARSLIETNSEVIEVNKQTYKNALDFFMPTTSKKNTLFDCIIAAIAKEYHADAIFSFDKFYPKNGFKLASDLQV